MLVNPAPFNMSVWEEPRYRPIDREGGRFCPILWFPHSQYRQIYRAAAYPPIYITGMFGLLAEWHLSHVYGQLRDVTWFISWSTIYKLCIASSLLDHFLYRWQFIMINKICMYQISSLPGGIGRHHLYIFQAIWDEPISINMCRLLRFSLFHGTCPKYDERRELSYAGPSYIISIHYFMPFLTILPCLSL